MSAATLRDTPGLEYQQLMEIAGVDYPERSERFDVCYCLLSLTKNRRIIVKVTTDEATPVPSVTGLWPVAGWLEREVFDMYGVGFAGNPDLRRILTDYGFEGYPQRKDFPLTGHVEMRYSEAEKRVVYEPVSLPQDFRTFDFLMPWEGPEYRASRRREGEGRSAGRAVPGSGAGRAGAAERENSGRDAEDDREACAIPAAASQLTTRRRSRRASLAQERPKAKSASPKPDADPKPQAADRRGADGSAGMTDTRSTLRTVESATVGASAAKAKRVRDELGHPRDPGDEKINNYTINFGPQHPAAHGVLRLIMELDGEIVERVDPHVGLLHRGTEKLIEYKTYTQATPYFDRLDYCSPMCMEHSFVLAIEKLLGLEIPLRAQYIRTMMAELTRIKNHMLNLGSHIMDVGAMTPNLWLFEVREDLMQIYEHVSGARMHANYFRPGGVREDIPPAVLDKIGEFLDNRLQLFEDAISLVADNRIFKQRNVDIGIVHKDDAHRLGLLGADDPRLGHPVGHPQVAALRSL